MVAGGLHSLYETVVRWLGDAVGADEVAVKQALEDVLAFNEQRRRCDRQLDGFKDGLIDCWEVDQESLRKFEEAQQLRTALAQELDDARAKLNRQGLTRLLPCYSVGTDFLDNAHIQLEQYQGAVNGLKPVVVEIKKNQLLPRPPFLAASTTLFQEPTHLRNIVMHLLSPVESPRVLVYGVAGMGKSTLSRQLLEMWKEDESDLRHRYVDGAYMVDWGFQPKLKSILAPSGAIQLVPVAPGEDGADDDNTNQHDAVKRLLKGHQTIAILEELHRRLQYTPNALLPMQKRMPVPEGALTLMSHDTLNRRKQKLLEDIQQLLKDRTQLLIFDNVWCERDAFDLLNEGSGFIPGSFKGVILVTSRHYVDEDMFMKQSCCLSLEPGPQFSESIIAAHAYGDQSATSFRSQHKMIGMQILDSVDQSPFVLRLIGSALRTGATTWRTVRRDLNRYLDLCNPDDDYRNSDTFKSIGLSVRHSRKLARLQLSCPEGLDKLFATLRLFSAMVKISINVVKVIWCSQSGCDPEKFQGLLCVLQQASLVDMHEACPPYRTGTVRVHAMVLQYLQRDKSIVLTHPLSAPKSLDMQSAGLIAQCCIRLFGKVSSAQHALESLKTIPPLPQEQAETATVATWWDTYSWQEFYPLDVGALIDASLQSKTNLGAKIVGELLFSAATGRLWAEFVGRLPQLMGSLETMNFALAIMVGAPPSIGLQAWELKHTKAVEGVLSALHHQRLQGTAATDAAHVLLQFWRPLFHVLTRYELARKVAAAAVELRTRALSNDDLWTLRARRCVAVSLRACGNLEQAQKECEQVLDTLQLQRLQDQAAAPATGATDNSPANDNAYNRVLYEEELKTMLDLSHILELQHRHEEALEKAGVALSGFKSIAGVNHPMYLGALRRVAWTKHRVGMAAESVKDFQAVAERHARTFGSKHLRTLVARAELAMAQTALCTSEAHGRALKGKQEVRDIMRETQLGQDHPVLVCLQRSIAVSLSNLGRHREAYEMDQQLLKIRKRRNSGSDQVNREILISEHDVALDLYHMERYGEALAMLEAIQRASEGANIMPIASNQLQRCVMVCKSQKELHEQQVQEDSTVLVSPDDGSQQALKPLQSKSLSGDGHTQDSDECMVKKELECVSVSTAVVTPVYW